MAGKHEALSFSIIACNNNHVGGPQWAGDIIYNYKDINIKRLQ